MAFDDALHQKMVKIVLWNVIDKTVSPTDQDIANAVKDSAKPKIRGIRSFFLAGFHELKKEVKKSTLKKQHHFK